MPKPLDYSIPSAGSSVLANGLPFIVLDEQPRLKVIVVKCG